MRTTDELLDLPKGGPSFPIIGSNSSWEETGGMSLRDWFAGQALIGVSQDPESYGWAPEGIATRAYKLADAMLEARKK